jgi:hypothetical protein
MSSPHRITPAHARRLAVRAQGLDGAWRPGRGAEGAAQTITRLGYVQLDTIAVIERTHEHTLWVRQPAYRADYLHRLLAEERRVFEYWAHAAAYLPMSDYRYYLRKMRQAHDSSRRVQWMKENPGVAEHVLERIRAEGGLAASEFQDLRGKRGPWWDWKPAKMALEALFNTGELMISERRSFQRVYDLRERVLPADVDTTEPESGERARWAVRRTLDNLGVADLSQMRIWHRDDGDMKAAIEDLVDAGEIVPVRIRGEADGPAFYSRPDLLRATARAGRRRRRVHLLSPFDNLVIRRPWLQRIFDFDYTLECYVPAKKRRYGYFCLPVLFGDRFVGRLDPKAERRDRVFVARRLWLDPEVGDGASLLPPLAETLAALAHFNGCDRVRLGSIRPAGLRAALRAALDAAS